MRTLAAFLFGLPVMWSAPSSAQLIDITAYVGPTKAVIRQIRSEWQPYLTDEQKRIDASIIYDVPVTWSSNGTAYRMAGGKRHIDIYAGQAFVLVQIVDIYIRSVSGQVSKRCFESYLLDVHNVFIHNSSAEVQRSGLKPMYPPAQYANRNPSKCNPVDGLPMPQDQWQFLVDAWMKDSLTMLLSHELGHQIYGHRADVPASQSRKQESEADEFAVKLMIAKDPVSILGALPLMTYWSMGSPTKSSGEIGQTHPAGLRRLRNALDVLDLELANNPGNQFRRYLDQKNEYQKFLSMIAELRDRTSKLQ